MQFNTPGCPQLLNNDHVTWDVDEINRVIRGKFHGVLPDATKRFVNNLMNYNNYFLVYQGLVDSDEDSFSPRPITRELCVHGSTYKNIRWFTRNRDDTGMPFYEEPIEFEISSQDLHDCIQLPQPEK